jgi:hypothetical protein
MNGKEIYHEYLKNRDYKGSDADCYAQELMTMFLHIGKQLFSLLEIAVSENKKLRIKTQKMFCDEISIEDIEMIKNDLKAV